jgi:molybdopterin molybdotransferase
MAAPPLSVAEALALVLTAAQPLAPRRIPLDQSLGTTLAQAIVADADAPPHAKAMMDGYAVCASDPARGEATLELLEEVTAGQVPSRSLVPGTTTRVMTGAPVPPGADAVVMLEKSELLAAAAGSGPRVRLRDAGARPGQHLMPQGEIWRKGEVLLAPGTALDPARIGLAAEAGLRELLVHPAPRVAVLATGNELLAPGEPLAPGRIRNSNGPLLVAAVRQAGCEPVDLGIARDDPAALAEAIAHGLGAADVLVLSGGVSAGVLDLAPAALEACGIQRVFHRVRIKPGQPLWFGTRQREAGPQLAFGLPGNPVSSFVCFQVFVRPALERLGAPRTLSAMVQATLAGDHRQRGDRPTYFPAVLIPPQASQTLANVRPVRWAGSSDLRGLAQANALVLFPAGDRQFAAGEVVEVQPLG